VVEPSVHHVQETYGRYHWTVFDKNGTFHKEQWDNYSPDEKSNLCQIAMTNEYFYYTVLLLWTLSCMHEIRTGQQLGGNIFRVPRAETFGDQILLDETNESQLFIRALKPVVKCVMIGIVVFPKIIISFFLMELGMRWLSATTSFEELVMNAVAMTFVTQIDELLYHFALPANYRKQVADINFSHDITPEEAETESWFAYVRSVFYGCLSVVIVYLYASIFQDVLPGSVHEAGQYCADWQREHTISRCHDSLGGFFRKVLHGGFTATATHGETCYPYGEAYHSR